MDERATLKLNAKNKLQSILKFKKKIHKKKQFTPHRQTNRQQQQQQKKSRATTNKSIN